MLGKRVAILQSNYIPWKGYYDIIGIVDEFIIYDEVQYTKNDWRNRNRIKTPSGLQWLTIPVYQKSLQQKISETQICNHKWGIKNWNSLRANYSKAPYFKLYSSVFEECYRSIKTPFLSEINVSFLEATCKLLGIETKITNSIDYDLKGDPTEKLIGVCKQSHANYYISGPAAKNYLRLDLFAEENIKIEWMNYEDYPEYPQLYPPFEHRVSILDLLFNVGPSSRDFMKSTKL